MNVGWKAPTTITDELLCLEWKWSLNDLFAVYGFEILNTSKDVRLAWAFCVTRDGFLDIEEFFVWPEDRAKGYGRRLSEMVTQLAGTLRLPLRMLVSFADTESANLEGAKAAAQMLRLNLTESSERWVHLIGLAHPGELKLRRRRPAHPANVLEFLRPRDEQPIREPLDFTVFFGTDRHIALRHNEPLEATGERGGSLTLGLARVQIPATHKFGSRGRWWVHVWRSIMRDVIAVREVDVYVDSEQLVEVVSSVVEAYRYAPDGPHNLLVVHGFNVSFENAIRQAAQLGVDLKIPGATFLYSWPSAGRSAAYVVDEATIDASLPYLEQFISLILDRFPDVPLSILVHSMGNRVVVRYLENLARADTLPHRGRIANVIFAAPDVDTEVFMNAATLFSGIPGRSTLYATWGDIALRASELMHGSPRAGLAPPVVTVPGMDTVVVEGFNLLELGHGYHGSASAVIHDLFMLINDGSPPSRRPIIRAATTEDGRAYWRLPLP